MSDYSVTVSKQAVDKLTQHVRSLAQSGKDANRLIKAFSSGTDALSHVPSKYPALTDAYLPAHKYHKMPLLKRYLLIYRILGANVFVEDVIDCAGDYDWLM